MLLELVYIQRVKEATRSLWNDIETCRRGRKVMERNRRSWNLMEVSGKRKNIPQVSYVIDGESGPEYSPKKGKRKLGKKEAVCDITPLLTSFRRCQNSTAHLQRHNVRFQSQGGQGRPYQGCEPYRIRHTAVQFTVPIRLRVPVNRNRTVVLKFRDGTVRVYIRPYYGVIWDYTGVIL